MYALRSVRLLSRTPVVAAVRQVAALQQLPQRRFTTYASVVNFPREEISDRLTKLEDAVDPFPRTASRFQDVMSLKESTLRRMG